ncbi:MAG: Fic family protein [Gammaproteobacteria bacterium]|jgi:Fic family protein
MEKIQMNINKIQWIWQQPHWPQFHWNDEELQPIIQRIRYQQGLLLGKISVPDSQFSLEATLDTLVQNILTSSAIEGEYPNAASVRSSIAKRLGLNQQQNHSSSTRSEGLAEIILDSIQNIKEPLTLERLFKWHQWLFPQDQFSLTSIQVGKLRGSEPMQIVSGKIDNPTIHYEAPPRERLDHEIKLFINWFNQSRENTSLDPLIRAAICHLWFEVIHPFEDGNGRIGRALTDLALAQADQASIHFYAMSVCILQHRKIYYQSLEQSKHLEITPWIIWFLNTLEDSIKNAIDHIERLLFKIKFWQYHRNTDLNDEERKVLNKLLDEEHHFPQGINATQYQKIAKVSKATATRHLSDLLQKKCIEKLQSGGRSTRYQIMRIMA